MRSEIAMPNLSRRTRVPASTVSLLTYTSKMPGPSWSLPAHKACPRANGSICADCYASKGCYRYRSPRHAQAVRFDWTIACIRSEVGRRLWVDYMVSAIRRSGCRYFRVHDSGDMFSAVYAESWLDVCRKLPNVRLRVPTRAWQQPTGPLPVIDPLLGVNAQVGQAS
jgi:hypothetical protein